MRTIREAFIALFFVMALLWGFTLLAPKEYYERLQAAGDSVASIATLATALALYLTARQFSLSRQQFVSTLYSEMKSHFHKINPHAYNKRKVRETLNALDFIATSVRTGIVDEQTSLVLMGDAFLELVDHIRKINTELEIAGQKKNGNDWIESQMNITWLETRWRHARKDDGDASTNGDQSLCNL